MLAIWVVHGACFFVLVFAVGVRVLAIHIVRGSWCWCIRLSLRVHELAVHVVRGVGAVDFHGTQFKVRVVCDDVLVLPLCPRLRLVFSCVLVIAATNSHLPLSLLYHSCLPNIVESSLSVVVVNLLCLWPLYKEIVLTYTLVSRS